MGRSRGSAGCRCTRSSVSLAFWFSLLLVVTAANAQQTPSPQTSTTNNQVPEVRTTPGVGILPSSTFDPSSLIRQNLPGAAPAQLSLADAINLPLPNNLSTLSAQEEPPNATGFTQQARSALLPNIS